MPLGQQEYVQHQIDTSAGMLRQLTYTSGVVAILTGVGALASVVRHGVGFSVFYAAVMAANAGALTLILARLYARSMPARARWWHRPLGFGFYAMAAVGVAACVKPFIAWALSS